MVAVGLGSLRRAAGGRRASFLESHLKKRRPKRQEMSASEVAMRGVTERHLLPCLQGRCSATVQTCAPETSLRAGDLGAGCFWPIRFFGAKRTLHHLHGSRRRGLKA